MAHPDCIVIGGGLIGMLSARELAAAGLSVTLLERGRTGSESSWAGGGILSPLYPWRYPDPVSALARWSQLHFPALAEELYHSGGVDPEWTQNGLLVLDAEEKEAALAWARERQVTMQWLDRHGTYACAPELVLESVAGHEGGIWMPQVAQVRNPRLVRAARGVIDAMGVEVRQQTEVQGILTESGRATGVSTSAGPISGGAVLVAGGAWSARLLEGLGPELPVSPVRGQMIVFRGHPGLVTRIILYRDRYLIPRRDGRVVTGSTLERVGFDKGVTEQARGELEAAARALVPALGEYEIERHWSGLRPGSPTGVPFIGEHPEIKALFMNTGHFRNGVVLGPASARLLADLVTGREPILDPAPYQLEQ